jgi:hypothetical protein
MKRTPFPAIVIVAVLLAVLGSLALAQQDKYAVRVPGGLAFSEFRGYENWQVVSISQDGGLLAAILANPVMIDAYRAGVPGAETGTLSSSALRRCLLLHWRQSTLSSPPSRASREVHDRANWR